MSKKKTKVDAAPTRFFVRELPGETPPAISTIEDLCGASARLFGLLPWNILNEEQLVLLRNPANGEMCYCSVMGSLGEVLALHAYLGDESYRIFRKILLGDKDSVEEFLESSRRVTVEFVPPTELEAPDRKLLVSLGYPVRKTHACPIFRSGRPGFHQWYVTEDEARLLLECVRVVFVVCSMVSQGAKVDYWTKEGEYPLVTPLQGEGLKMNFRIEPIEIPVPREPAFTPGSLYQDKLRQLRHQDHNVGGILELDWIVRPSLIGARNERKAFLRFALAVDGETGLLLPMEIAAPGISSVQALVEVVVKAIQSSGKIPSEVRVSSQRVKACLGPLSSLCGFSVKVVRSLPALSAAKRALLKHLGGE